MRPSAVKYLWELTKWLVGAATVGDVAAYHRLVVSRLGIWTHVGVLRPHPSGSRATDVCRPPSPHY